MRWLTEEGGCYNESTRRFDLCMEGDYMSYTPCTRSGSCPNFQVVVCHTTPENFINVVTPFYGNKPVTYKKRGESKEYGPGLSDHIWIGHITDVRWWGRFKSGQIWQAYPNAECCHDHIPNKDVMPLIDILDQLQPDCIRYNMDKVTWFSSLLDWARKEGLLTSRETEPIYRWMGNEELF